MSERVSDAPNPCVPLQQGAAEAAHLHETIMCEINERTRRAGARLIAQANSARSTPATSLKTEAVIDR